MSNNQNPSKNDFTFVNILVLVLSIYVLGAMIVDTLFKIPEEVGKVLQITDYGICIFFLFEFVVKFIKAESKLKFMKWGWIDLISSIPNLDVLRYGRVFRLIRLFRIIRAFKSTQEFVNHVFENRTQGAFSTAFVIAILLILFSSISILHFEDDPESNIRTAGDALWWSYFTMTTVGYGDYSPVTWEGRIIGAILMAAGVGLFGTFTGFISSWMLSGTKKED